MADDTFERTQEAIQATSTASDQETIAALRELVARRDDELRELRAKYESLLACFDSFTRSVEDMRR